MIRKLLTASVLVIYVLILAGCGSGSLTVNDAWARPVNAGGNSAVYFVIDNSTGQDDVLLGASTEIAQSAELHRSEMGAGDVMMMHPQEAVEVPRRSKVTFEPAGLHVMLVNLAQDLAPGDSLSLTLNFEQAGEVRLDVPVREP
jgi:copper(I)-binding protein